MNVVDLTKSSPYLPRNNLPNFNKSRPLFFTYPVPVRFLRLCFCLREEASFHADRYTNLPPPEGHQTPSPAFCNLYTYTTTKHSLLCLTESGLSLNHLSHFR